MYHSFPWDDTDLNSSAILSTRFKSKPLRTNSSRVAGEHAALANVRQTQVEHHHALQPDPAPAVRERPVPEGVDVRRDRIDVDSPGACAFLEELRFVDALCARQDLLTADEHIVTIG